MPTVTVKISKGIYMEWSTICDSWEGKPFKSLIELWKYWRGWKSSRRFSREGAIGFWRAVKRIWVLITVGATHTYKRKDFREEIIKLMDK